MNENFDINGYIRKSLEGFDVQPRITSFDAILQRIQKRKKRRFFIIFFFGLLGVIVSTVCILNPSSVHSTSENFKAQPASAFKDPKAKKDLPVTLQKKFSSGEKIQVSKTGLDISNKKNQKKTSINTGSNSIKPINNTVTTKQSFLQTMNALSPKNTGTPSVPQLVQVDTATTHSSAQNGITTIQPYVNTETMTTPSSENTAGRSTLASEQAIVVVDTEIIHNVPFVFLEPKSFILQDTVSYELMTSPGTLTQAPGPDRNPKLKKKKLFSFLVGLNYNPQWSSYIFLKTNNAVKFMIVTVENPFQSFTSKIERSRIHLHITTHMA